MPGNGGVGVVQRVLASVVVAGFFVVAGANFWPHTRVGLHAERSLYWPVDAKARDDLPHLAAEHRTQRIRESEHTFHLRMGNVVPDRPLVAPRDELVDPAEALAFAGVEVRVDPALDPRLSDEQAAFLDAHAAYTGLRQDHDLPYVIVTPLDPDGRAPLRAMLHDDTLYIVDEATLAAAGRGAGQEVGRS